MAAPLLLVQNVGKSFPGVRALDDVTFELDRGRVVTLAGENGAGKSTLLNILGGSLSPDRGTIQIEGAIRSDYTPRQALAEGVVIAHQEPAIVPQLSVEQNFLLGMSASRRKLVRENVLAALEDMARMGFPVNARDIVGQLSPAQRHALTIAKAFAFGAKIVALDEPTTSMLEHNVAAVLSRVRELAHQRGVGVIFVSHKMPEVMAVSDDVVVLRDGKVGFSSPIKATSIPEIVRRMVGRELLEYAREYRLPDTAGVLFEATDVRHPSGVGPVDLRVRAGEVLGIAGLVGSGRTELLRSIVHADAGSKATVTLDGTPISIHSPHDSRSAGIAFIPEDRKAQGLVLLMPAFSNIALTAGAAFVGPGKTIKPAKQAETAAEVAKELSLRPPNVKLLSRQFSGGNQQKLVVAKWLRRDSRVFLFDEPTKGVDVGGRAEIYALIDQLAAAGHAIVVVSSDLPEIIALSDRVLVMRAGRVVAEHTGAEITEESLVASAMGMEKHAS